MVAKVEVVETKNEVADKSNVVIKKLKPEVEDLSNKIITGLDLDVSSGVITETANNYIENLPEGITPEIDAAVSEYRTRFVAASAHAVGCLAVTGMKNNENLNTVTANLNMGKKDHVNHGVTRSVDYSYGPSNNRQTVTKTGVVVTDLYIHGGENAGQLKTSRELIGQLAAQELLKR